MTKWKILSEIAKLFDPVRWVSPISAKLLMQEMWMSGHDWDKTVPVTIEEKCRVISMDLEKLSENKIAKSIYIMPNSAKIELHDFEGASMQAYATVVYVRSSIDTKKSSTT